MMMFFVFILVFGLAPVAKAQILDLSSLQDKINELSQKLTELQNRSFSIQNNTPKTLWTRITKKPMQLKVGEQGEWRVRILRLASTTPYTLQISWGEEPVVGMMKLPPPGKTNQMIFLHQKYTKPGNYNIQLIGKQGNQMSVAETTVVVTP